MKIITTRTNVVDVDGTLVTLLVGLPEAEFGDEVALTSVFPPKEYPTLYVQGTDTVSASDVEAETLNLLGFTEGTVLHLVLSRLYQTGFAPSVPVTIYTFSPTEFYLQDRTKVVPLQVGAQATVETAADVISTTLRLAAAA